MLKARLGAQGQPDFGIQRGQVAISHYDAYTDLAADKAVIRRVRLVLKCGLLLAYLSPGNQKGCEVGQPSLTASPIGMPPRSSHEDGLAL